MIQPAVVRFTVRLQVNGVSRQSVVSIHQNKPEQLTLETHGKSLKKWACIFPIFHAAVLLDSSN